MKIYLAGEHPVKNGRQAKSWDGMNILESFYYCRNNRHFRRLFPTCKNFILDSGAYSFMRGNHGDVNDWKSYTISYGEFIAEYDIDLFFEMDIDNLVGIEEVERLRKIIENVTGKKPIPVWHRDRGKDYFLKMCDEYEYVAFGGILTDGIPKSKIDRCLPWFITEAHRRGAKIHGLGYTSLTKLKNLHFDSVDSTAWLYGNMSGCVYKFRNDGTMDKIEGKGRLKSTNVARHNFNEWVKFSKYASLYL